MHPALRMFATPVIALFLLLSATTAPVCSQPAEPLKLGIHPYLSSSELVRRFTPLAEYLEKQLGRPVSVGIANSYNAHIQQIGNGLVDIAFMGPSSYVLLTGQYGSRPLLAAFSTQEGKVFRGRIVVRKDSPITSLAQLKGKRFAFGDPDSTMSHFVPRSLLLKSGIDVKQLSEVKYVANHDNIALGILAGTFDAGAVKEEVFKQYEPQGLRSLARSAPIPDHVFICRAGLPAETVTALQNALLHLKDSVEGRRILSSIRNDLVSLVPADDRDFDGLRAMMRELKKAGVAL